MLHDPKWDVDAVGKELLTAADYMEEHGWCQRLLQSEGRVCITGAIYLTGGGESGKAMQRLRKYLGQAPHWWNDTHCTSKEQAVAALRQAATCK